MDQLFLIRHGQTSYNAQKRFQGQVDVELDKTGQAQALALATHLQTAGITRIVSSDLARARATAQALADTTGIAVDTDPRLREISVGEWEGYTSAEIAQRWPQELAAWHSGADMRPPGGESRAEASKRVADAVVAHRQAAAAHEVLAIVAHGAVIRGATGLLLGLDNASHGQLSGLDNCEYAHFLIRDDRWVLRRWAGTAA